MVRTGVPEVRLTGSPESCVLDALAGYKFPAPEATVPGHAQGVSTLVRERQRALGWLVVLWERLRNRPPRAISRGPWGFPREETIVPFWSVV